MKTIVSVFFVLFAVVAIAHSASFPQAEIVVEVEQAAETEAPTKFSVLDGLFGLVNTGMDAVISFFFYNESTLADVKEKLRVYCHIKIGSN